MLANLHPLINLLSRHNLRTCITGPKYVYVQLAAAIFQDSGFKSEVVSLRRCASLGRDFATVPGSFGLGEFEYLWNDMALNCSM